MAFLLSLVLLRWEYRNNIGVLMTFSSFTILLLVGLLILCMLVSISDYRFRRIPNKYLLFASSYALLIILSMFLFLPSKQVFMGLFMSVLGLIMGWLFLYPAYLIKQVGAGDVKLMMVFGLFMGPKGTILTILFGAMIGGVWALILAWQHGGLKHMWHNMKFMAKSAYLSGFKDMGWDLKSEKAIKMPYGVALSLGASIVAIEQLLIQYHKLVLS